MSWSMHQNTLILLACRRQGWLTLYFSQIQETVTNDNVLHHLQYRNYIILPHRSHAYLIKPCMKHMYIIQSYEAQILQNCWSIIAVPISEIDTHMVPFFFHFQKKLLSDKLGIFLLYIWDATSGATNLFLRCVESVRSINV